MKRMISRGSKHARIGLVIDADAVRAVSVERSGGLTVSRAGEVPLAPGSVGGGEITDVAHVAEALRELWRVGEFDSRDVNLAMASPRVAIRPVDVPKMADDELRSALKFQIGDHLPINPDDAIVDFQPLGAPDPERDTRPVLLVAAHRDSISAAVDAAQQAGLHVRRVDVIPLLLARVGAPLLPSSSDTSAEPPLGLEALVDVGDDVTNVVLVYGGNAVFARTLGAGLGRDVLASGGDASQLADRLFPLMEEVRNTLAFATTQLRAGKVTAVVASVADASEKLLTDCLRATLGVPVVPMRAVDLLGAYGGASPYSLDRAFLSALAAALPAAAPPGLHVPSLLPQVFDAAAAARRERLMLAGAVGALVAGLAVTSLVKANSVSSARSEVTKARAAQATLQKQVDALRPAELEANRIRALQDKLRAAVAGSIDVPRVLNEIADTLPTEAAVRNLSVARESVSYSVVADSDSAATQILDVTATGAPRLRSVFIGSVNIQALKAGSQSTFTVTAKPSAAALADRLSKFGVK